MTSAATIPWVRNPDARRRRTPTAGPLLSIVVLAVLGIADTAAAKYLPIAGLQPGIVRVAQPGDGTVRLTYLGHSSFLIETPGGATAVTDFNGVNRPAAPPDVVTMNNAHSSHYTDFIRPEIERVLRGWDPAGGMAVHDVTHRDLRIWNVPTNVRQGGGTRYNGNSIFVFEAAGLCIAHLGHLHHVLTDQHLAALGEVDVLLVPVDGGLTMAHGDMLQVIDQIRAPLVIPMHFVAFGSLQRFLTLIGDRYDVLVAEEPTVTLSRLTLPYRKVLVLPGG